MRSINRHRDVNRIPPIKEYTVAAWSAAVIGIALSLTAFWGIHSQLKAHQLLEFKWVSENRHRALVKEIDDQLQAVESMHNLFLVSGAINQKEFQAAAATLLERYRAVSSLALLPRFKTSTAQADETGSTQVATDGATRDTVDAIRVDRLPPRFFALREGNKHLVDFASSARYKELLARARDDGNTVVSGRVPLGSVAGDGFGVVAFKPVYRRGVPASVDQRRVNLTGFVAGVLNIDALAKIATRVLGPRGVEFLIVDESAPEGEKYLEFYSSRLSPPSLSSTEKWLKWTQQTSPQLKDSIHLGGRKWSVTYAPTNEFRSAEGFQQGPWVVLVSGMLLTALLTLYLLRIRQDLQVRSRMENALREREELFRQMTDAIEEVFWIQTPDSSEVLYVSPAYEKIWGRSRDSLYQDPFSFLDGVHPEDRGVVRENLESVPTAEVEQVFRVIRPDGTLRWVRSRAFSVHNDKGFLYRIAGIREDITKIKEVEEALRKSEKELRLLIDQSPDVIKTVDEKGLILSMNRNLKDLSASQAIGMDAAEMLPSEYRKRFRKKLRKVFQKGKGDHFQYLTDNSEWWDMRLVPIRRDGIVVESMMVETDITEKRKLQEQANRNARLASLGVISASVAHEINNPNNAIQFNASMLSRIAEEALPIIKRYRDENGEFLLGGLPVDKATETLPRLIKGISKSSQRIQKIVSNLKHMARRDKGGISGDVDLLEVIQESISILRNQIHKFTDNFSLKLADTLPHVKGNQQQLEQVFINVILNALQSLPDRTHGVSVCAYLEKKGEHVVVEVCDQGQGIPKEKIGVITEPFFTTKDDAGGTGLGLSISNTIIRSHKGRMDFSSKPGVGTTVTIKLPAGSVRLEEL